MPDTTPIQIKALRNHGPCAVNGCHNPKVRGSAGKYCMTHRTRFRRFGDPEATYIRRRWYEEQTELARRILKSNSEHPGYTYSWEFMTKLLRGRLFSSRGRMRLYSLAWEQVGLKSDEALAHLIGHRRFHDLDEIGRMIRTHQQLLYQYGSLLLVELGKPSRIGVPARNVRDIERLWLGKLVNKQIGVFLVMGSRAITQWEEIQEQRKKDLTAPFNLDL